MVKDEEAEIEIENDEMKKFRSFKGIIKKLIFIFAVVFSLFQMYIIYFPLNTIQVRIIHLMFALVLIFILIPGIKSVKSYDRISIIDGALVLSTIFSCLYIAIESIQLSNERLGNYNNMDVVVSTIIVLLVLESTRRILGWILPIIAIAFILYAHFGNWIPGTLGNSGFSFNRIVTTLSLWTEGILGTPLGVSASYVALFIIFAVFLQQTGAGQFFIDFSLSLFGRFRGGPAKVAVVASSLFGSVSGSAVANVAGTGTLTIPLMKKSGFSKADAAGVEAVASTGGQLMPPIMGAAAFIMVEVLNVPLIYIIVAAVIPAILYYLSVFIQVDLKAVNSGLVGLEKKQLPNLKKVIIERWHLSIPLIILIYLLSVVNTSPGKAALWATIASVVVTMFSKKTRMTFKNILVALERGAYAVLEIVAVCACAGIIIGVFSLTGLGLKFSGIIIDLAQENIILLLILTMIACLIAGMGVPTVAAYLIVSVLVAPALITMGAEPIAAHMFVFYFAIISAITPPVALASYVAAGIAGSKPFITSIRAFKLGLSGFIIPFMFVFNPTLLMVGEPLEIVISIITAVLGVTLLAGTVEGYFYYLNKLSSLLRVLLLIIALSLIHPNIWTDLFGVIAIAMIFGFVWLKRSVMKTEIIN
ncbi:TRAP transporter permease [Sporosarcina sp. Marseille-Q4063]|uniref:TRAP transporter permease n=1 Tax=Sporosarcina sp. Marseille-Q4063 TaxID=2810514 RepID=UPI001BAF11FB|nr:TRAP transporter permease [Sporosarcina sp. Marseille-Q4063]QUW21277.1 TRAP transporter permease [Sporosarcina sp. Marseille-Q4063]